MRFIYCVQFVCVRTPFSQGVYMSNLLLTTTTNTTTNKLNKKTNKHQTSIEPSYSLALFFSNSLNLSLSIKATNFILPLEKKNNFRCSLTINRLRAILLQLDARKKKLTRTLENRN